MEKKPSVNDRERLNQINGELAERLVEVASIAARTLGYKRPVKEVFLDEAEGKTGAASSRGHAEKRKAHRGRRKFHMVEVVTIGTRIYFVTSDGCGYYDLEQQICVEAPCD